MQMLTTRGPKHPLSHTCMALCLFSKYRKTSNNPDACYPDRLGPSGKFVENSTKLTCLEVTAYRIKYSTASRTSNQMRSKGLDTGIYCK